MEDVLLFMGIILISYSSNDLLSFCMVFPPEHSSKNINTEFTALIFTCCLLQMSPFFIILRVTSVFLPPIGASYYAYNVFLLFIVCSETSYKNGKLNTVISLLMNTIYALASPHARESCQLSVSSLWNKQQSEMITALLHYRICHLTTSKTFQ